MLMLPREPTASLSSFIRSECVSIKLMKMTLLSILVALLACLSLPAQTNFPVRGVVANLYFIETSFRFTNNTPDLLQCDFYGGIWTLGQDGYTNSIPVSGFGFTILQPGDSFYQTWAAGQGPVMVTNAIYPVVYPATNAVPNITPPPITVTNHVAAAPFTSGTLTLAWSNPYVGSNWVTVIKGSPVLGIPRSQWPMIWEGYAVSNGRATLTITNPTEFVTANNQIGF